MVIESRSHVPLLAPWQLLKRFMVHFPWYQGFNHKVFLAVYTLIIYPLYLVAHIDHWPRKSPCLARSALFLRFYLLLWKWTHACFLLGEMPSPWSYSCPICPFKLFWLQNENTFTEGRIVYLAAAGKRCFCSWTGYWLGHRLGSALHGHCLEAHHRGCRRQSCHSDWFHAICLPF